MVTAMRQSHDLCAWFAENVDFVFEAQFSLVLVETHDNRTVNAGAGTGGRRGSMISRRMSANGWREMTVSLSCHARRRWILAVLRLRLFSLISVTTGGV